MNRKEKSRAGFTLIEVFIAMFVVVVGVFGASALVSQTVSFAPNASSQLAATYLAQEGIEVVRNIRDTNFLRMHSGVSGAKWDDGLMTVCVGGCEADSQSTGLVAQDRFLNISGGFYSYMAGAGSVQTPYKRKIFLSSSGIDTLDVRVDVTWQIKSGATRTVSAATKLYNWLAPTP